MIQRRRWIRAGLIGDLKEALAERMLNTEMDVHLAQESEAGVANHRNGSSAKTVLTPEGSMERSIPRDRHGRFDPALISKYRRRFPGFDDKIIALYARGMSTRDIQGHVRELERRRLFFLLSKALCQARLPHSTHLLLR